MHQGRYRIVLAAISTLDIGRDIERATSGWIESDAEPGIRKNAMSGWTSETANGNMLDSETYTARVQEVSKALGFYIPGHRFDNGWKPALPHQVGKFNACHIVCSH